MKVMIVIGCGGGFFHGLPLMRNWLAKRDDDVLVCLMDGDVVEPQNRLRQWAQAGIRKVDAAQQALEGLGFPGSQICKSFRMFGHSEDVRIMEDFIETHRADEVVWVGMPDNHKARVDMFRIAESVWQHTKVPSVVCTSGNDGDRGFAYLARIAEEGIYNNWLETHPDIVTEAKKEVDEQRRVEEDRARGIGCGVMPDTGGITQTAVSNWASSGCRWRILEKAMQDKKHGWDVIWHEGDYESLQFNIIQRGLPNREVRL